MLTARHDPKQFLDLRLNVDPGVAFYALQDPKHRLWFEAGYDLQYDIYSEDAVAGDGMPVPDDLVTHASRLFAGYSNSLNENVTVNTGVEYLQSLTAVEQHRVNWDSVLTFQLINRLSLASSFTLRYESRIEENKPEGFKPVDTITSLNLVYRIR